MLQAAARQMYEALKAAEPGAWLLAAMADTDAADRYLQIQAAISAAEGRTSNDVLDALRRIAANVREGRHG
jgi:nitrogen fixation protein FixH